VAGRSEFFYVSFAIYTLIAFPYFAARDYFSESIDIKVFLLLRSFVGLIMVLLFLPTAVRRLHSLRFNRHISLLLFLPPVFNFRNFASLGIDLSAQLTYILLGLSVIGCVVYLALLLLPSRSSSKS